MWTGPGAARAARGTAVQATMAQPSDVRSSFMRLNFSGRYPTQQEGATGFIVGPTQLFYLVLVSVLVSAPLSCFRPITHIGNPAATIWPTRISQVIQRASASPRSTIRHLASSDVA
jgi:hypothetical protein